MKATILLKNGTTRTVELNRRKAIHERCLNCVGWESHQVNSCGVIDCILHPFRSGKGKQSPGERSRAIKLYCKDCTNGKVRYCATEDCPLFSYSR